MNNKLNKKDPREPKDYHKKSQLLKSRGWYEWYHPDNWCHDVKLNTFNDEYFDATRVGVRINDAYKMEFEADMKEIVNE